MIQVFSESIKEERRLGHEAYITIRKGRILQIAGGWAESVWRTGNCSLSGRAAQWCQSHCKSLSDCRWRRIYAGLYRGREWAYSPCGFRFCNRWSAVVSHEYSVHTGISSRLAVSPYSCFGRKKFPVLLIAGMILVHRILSNCHIDLSDFSSAALSSVAVATATPPSSALYMRKSSYVNIADT